MLPVVHKEKLYDLKDIAKLIKSDPAFIIGAGAGPNTYIGVNCEVIKIQIFLEYDEKLESY